MADTTEPKRPPSGYRGRNGEGKVTVANTILRTGTWLASHPLRLAADRFRLWLRMLIAIASWSDLTDLYTDQRHYPMPSNEPMPSKEPMPS